MGKAVAILSHKGLILDLLERNDYAPERRVAGRFSEEIDSHENFQTATTAQNDPPILFVAESTYRTRAWLVRVVPTGRHKLLVEWREV